MSFVHLHVHSEYSLLDGLAKIEDLIDRAKELKMDSLAITDHGAMYGAVKFYNAAKDAGIKPIIGVEAYMAERSRFDKQPGVDKDQFHQLLLAKNELGYRNLMKLTTLAHLEGQYYKPRIDREILAKFHEGIIVTSSCLQGEAPQQILKNDLAAAKKTIEWFQEVFGEDYYLELQQHPKIAEQDVINRQIVKFSRELGIPLVATNDVHYVRAEDAEAQDALLAIQTKKFLADKNRLTMIDSPDFYLRSTKEMEELFREWPDAVTNTEKAAAKCDLEIPTGKWILPHYPIEAGETPESTLKKMTIEGLNYRFGKITEEMKQRVDYELGVICKKGFATYFLIVGDFVNWAKNQGIRVGPGRGSVAGSLSAYALRITSINPLEHDIPFERFMNPDRPTPPDIDLDFADDRRDEVIEYVTQKYGDDKVAQIVTFGTMEARQAIRDVGRVMGLTYSVPDRLAKMIPAKFSIEQALGSNFQMQEEAKDETVGKLLSLAKRLEGVARHASTHAAGVVIADKPLVEYTPLSRESRADRVITQYDMYSLDLNVSDKAIGLLKMDFLGLRNLTILGKAVELVKELRNETVDLSNISLDEPKVYQMIAAGETTGVFQLESHGMRRLAKNLKPNKFSDITAMVALFRPGPMELIDDFVAGKQHPESVKYLHQSLKEILEPTYGVAVYQEQCMQIANKVAGYTMAEADNLRRAIGKKKKSIMAKERKKFIEGALKNGYGQNIAEKIWGFIENFVGYGFNIPHSVSYAMIAYQTGYMKVKYPVEYMTAFLTAEARASSGPVRDVKVSEGIGECRRLGIMVLPPDLNKSKANFSVEENKASLEGKAIRFGLSAIKNVGEAAIFAILAAGDKGEFKNLADFVVRVDGQKVNKKVVESLIQVGATDTWPGTRAGKLAGLDQLRSRQAAKIKRQSQGQTSLFDQEGGEEAADEDKIPNLPEFAKDELLKSEKMLLGVYISEHPLLRYLEPVRDRLTHRISDLTVEENQGQTVIIAGMCTQIKTVVTKRTNETMAFLNLADETANIETVVFPEMYRKMERRMAAETPFLIRGKVDFRNDRLGLVAEKIWCLLDDVNEGEIGEIREIGEAETIDIGRGVPKEVLSQLAALLKSTEGKTQVQIRLPNKIMVLPYRVDWKAIEDRVKNLLKSESAVN
jgi:DNA polymerase-3 subunit alpha